MRIVPDVRRRVPLVGSPEITVGDVLWSVTFWGLVAGLVWVVARWLA